MTVRAAAFPEGLRTVKIESVTVVEIKANPYDVLRYRFILLYDSGQEMTQMNTNAASDDKEQ